MRNARNVRRSSLFRIGVVMGAVALLAALGPPAAGDDGRQERDSIYIAKDSQFDSEHGVRSGSGTASDPYVISGWDVRDLEIHDTSAYVRIVNNTVQRQLTLNWIGPGVHVMNNKAGDLRVNENVRRTGEPTSGHFSNNTFGFVGQIRHFDGTFEDNVVKPGTPGFDWDAIPFLENGPAVNFDGFNGAHFTNNTIYGPLRAQLHGHHHSTGFGEPSHMHASEHEHAEHGSHGETMDHSRRWHEVWITDNVIHADAPYALSYTDVAHSANDRTASSEQEPALNKPHTHYTRVHLNRNELVGSGLLVDVFNARDDRHTGTNRGLVEIRGNDITMTPIEDTDVFDYKYAGIEVEQARDIELRIIDNSIVGQTEEDDGLPDLDLFYGSSPSAIRLWQIDLGMVYLFDNVVANHEYGVEAQGFKNVTWFLDGFRTRNVNQDLTYDKSAGPPQKRP